MWKQIKSQTPCLNLLKWWVVCIFFSLAQSVRLMMALAIFLSYGLQFYVPMNIIWPLVRPYLHSERAQMFGDYLIRTCLVVFTCEFLLFTPRCPLPSKPMNTMTRFKPFHSFRITFLWVQPVYLGITFPPC